MFREPTLTTENCTQMTQDFDYSPLGSIKTSHTLYLSRVWNFIHKFSQAQDLHKKEIERDLESRFLKNVSPLGNFFSWQNAAIGQDILGLTALLKYNIRLWLITEPLINYPQCWSFGMSSFSKIGLSTPTPIVFKPLSTYITAPVMAEAKGDAKKAAVFPTSSV